MRTAKLFSLCFISALLWNCDQPTQSDAKARNERLATPGINALTKAAALNAGLRISREVPPGLDASPFSSEALAAMRDAGLCDNFILLLDEMVQSEHDTAASYPQLTAVFNCVEKNAGSMSAAASVDEIMGVIDQCFCDGSGTLFGGFAGLTLNAYSRPGNPAGAGYSRPSPGSVYSTPTVPGYSAPFIPGYTAPSL